MDNIIVKKKPMHYKHTVVYYVPVFQVNFDENGNLLNNPSFQYNLGMGDTDVQLIASYNPDYILELKGDFDATTKDIILKEE